MEGQKNISLKEYYTFRYESQRKWNLVNNDKYVHSNSLPFWINIPLQADSRIQIEYYLNEGIFIEVDSENIDHIKVFDTYDKLVKYVNSENMHFKLKENFNDLFPTYYYAENYINCKHKIIQLDQYKSEFIQLIEDTILGKKMLLNDHTILEIENLIQSELYGEEINFEIPLIVFLCSDAVNSGRAKWIIKSDKNIFGEEYYYPDILMNDGREIEFRDKLTRVIYNNELEPIYNIRYLYNLTF
jgi:hypothetical protein